jgi:hypothetical protein
LLQSHPQFVAARSLMLVPPRIWLHFILCIDACQCFSNFSNYPFQFKKSMLYSLGTS